MSKKSNLDIMTSMDRQTFVLVGRSGSGKGTQANLLMEKIKQFGPADIFYLQTGQRFRDFISSPGYTTELSKGLEESGKLQPSFLAIWIWSNILIENLKMTQHLVIDGTPRKLGEAVIFIDAMKFYERRARVINIEVSREWSKERLLGRQRSDDVEALIDKRLDWFDLDVLPVIEYFRSCGEVDFYNINGEQTIEEVHQDIVKKLGW